MHSHILILNEPQMINELINLGFKHITEGDNKGKYSKGDMVVEPWQFDLSWTLYVNKNHNDSDTYNQLNDRGFELEIDDE